MNVLIQILTACAPILVALVGIIPTVVANRKKTDASIRETNEAVRLMQGLLMAQGYKLPKYGADGDFGSETFAALRQYQADHGLDVTGIYDDATAEMLTEGAAAARYVICTGNRVNIRTAPNTTTGKKLGKVDKGDMLPYQGVISDENWYLVTYNGQNGWICGKYARVDK